MFVYRWTMLIKHPHLQEAVKMTKEASERFWKPQNVVYRICSSDISPGNILIFEMEAKDEAQYTGYWKIYGEKEGNTPWTKDWWKKFNELVERQISFERWNLVT
jgi:hypothetical protein